MSARSAQSSVMINNNIDTSLGSIHSSASVNTDMRENDRGVINIHVGEDSYIRDERVVEAHLHAINLGD